MTSQESSRIGREGSKSEASLCATWDSGVPARRKTRGGPEDRWANLHTGGR